MRETNAEGDAEEASPHQTEEAKPRRANRKIIAFGDSLTVGFQSLNEATPYAMHLATLLPPDVTINIAAISGETTADMLWRFDRGVLQVSPDMVIILGGSNDIGWGLSTAVIFNNLQEMYQKALDAGIKPVACAVPSILGADFLIPPRMELNQKIQKEAHHLKIPFVDLFAATADPSSRLHKAYSYDGLHLNSKGYEKIAIAIYESVFKGT